jgi:centromeric protein E
MVDLAGSERLSPHHARRKVPDAAARGVEGGYINKSLLVLSTVIHKLSDAADAARSTRAGGSSTSATSTSVHVPYRSSKITRLLQNSLGGDALCLVVATVTPASMHAEETHNTLRFAARAKSIVTAATRQARQDPQALLAHHELTITRLRAEARPCGRSYFLAGGGVARHA